MPVRDLLITATVFMTLPFCFVRPWIGIVVWCWLAFMNPHRYSWGFAHDFPFAMLVAIATLVGVPFSSERKPFLWTRETLTLFALWMWFTLTSVFAMYPESAWVGWEKTSKILLMTVVIVPFFQDRRKLRLLLLVIAGSLGFFGAKAGLFVVVTGGQFMVLGPPDSFIETNNEVALALNMALPLLHYLAREEPRPWLRRVLRIAFGLTALAVPFTYSRGGLLGLVLVLSLLFLSARSRLLLLPVAMAALVAFMWFAPQRFFDRVETLQEYQADESANLRFMSWRVAYEIARDRPIFGGGFRVFLDRATYDIYLPEYPRSFGHDAHSIYFNLLGEHGWIGLGLFVLLIGFTMATLWRIGQRYRGSPQQGWAADYARMLQVSLSAYLVNGAFLSVAYFDLAYALIVLAPILGAVAAAEATGPAALEVAATTARPVAIGRVRALPPRAS
jgi:probable O-glycosylation ligase (exosortase A-associated)